MAVAVLGDAEAIKFVPLSAKVRFTALQSGEIDLLARNYDLDYAPGYSAGYSVYRRKLL